MDAHTCLQPHTLPQEVMISADCLGADIWLTFYFNFPSILIEKSGLFYFGCYLIFSFSRVHYLFLFRLSDYLAILR